MSVIQNQSSNKFVLTQEVVDSIAELCLDTYLKLPRNGKPTDAEWTVLSCIVKYEYIHHNIEVISLGTGSKCIGASKMSPLGDIIHDSHAEVFARRGFLLYLYDNIEKYMTGQHSIFQRGAKKLRIVDGVEFIFYSSHTPCGDASIIPKDGDEDLYGELVHTKRRADEKSMDYDCKRMKLGDVYRTGAKCLPDSDQDLNLPGENYHKLGQVRTKPGRGDRTLSVSCSDKMARWIHLGVQGALLDLLCEPIYIKHFVFGGSIPYCEDSLNRALFSRNPEFSLRGESIPKLYQSSLTFPHMKAEHNVRPAPGSIVWVNLLEPILEVAVQGRKLGVTKKNGNVPNNLLSISKYSIYKNFTNILRMNENLKFSLIGEDNIDNVPYNRMKLKSKRYLEKWAIIKEKFFKVWTTKPDMWDFCINET